MIRVNADYVIEVDDLNYTVMRDLHKKTKRTDKDGNKVEVDAYKIIGYYGNLSGAIKCAIEDMNVRELSDGVIELKKAVEIVAGNYKRFSDLIEGIEEV